MGTMMYLQKGKNELKEYVKQSGVKAIGTLEDTMQKRVLGMLVQRQGEALDLMDDVQAAVRAPLAEVPGRKRIRSDQILLSPVITAALSVAAIVFTFISALSGRPVPAENAGGGIQWQWLWVLLAALLILGQAVYGLIRKNGADKPEKVQITAELTLDLDRARLRQEKQLSRLMNDSQAVCAMFRGQQLDGANLCEDELVKLYASLFEAKVDRPDVAEISYSLTMAELLLRQHGLTPVPYSEEKKTLFNIGNEDYHDELRCPAIVRTKTGTLVRKGEYIRNIGKMPA